MSGSGANAIIDTLLTIAPCERVSSGRNAWVTPCVPKRLTARCCSSDGAIAQVVVEGDAGVVDENVEGLDRSTARLDLRRVGHVQDQGRDPLVMVGKRPAGAGVHPACASPQRFLDQRLADPTVGPGYQHCLAC